MPEKILVIGGVAAGPKTACRVKRLLPDAEVVVVDQDSLISYGGCGIPYFVSGDVSDEKELRSTSFHVVRDEAFFRDAKGVKMLTRTRALAIDRVAKTVRVEQFDTGETSSCLPPAVYPTVCRFPVQTLKGSTWSMICTAPLP
jgi:NADPH-dependent 2,4-dienoyl-CoA reductase/sulfur reductase-like enzyme